MTNTHLVSIFLVSTLYWCQLDSVFGVSDMGNELEYTEVDDLQPDRREALKGQEARREALNIQERNDMVRILTNNIRTGRQLDAKEIQDYLISLSNKLGNYQHKSQDLTPESYGNWQRQIKRGINKRQRISVPQLAQLLSSIKTRGVNEDGVKLQSLRFGR